LNVKPSYLGDISNKTYDGVSDDLLTAGLGKTGLAGATAYADPANPTAAELRRNAIHANYRAVLDISANSGYGTLYGPNVDAKGGVGHGRGQDRRHGIHRLRRRRQRQPERDADGAGAGRVRREKSLHRHRHVERLARHLRRHRQRWRMGLEEQLRGGVCDKGSGTGLYTFDDDSVNLQTGARARARRPARTASLRRR
jgi:hydroxybutyrate-dimer hydrolase